MNSILITGRLCADPELRQTQSGVSVCQFRVAVNRRFANKQTGEREADFISCVAWRQTADFVSRYFRKGGWIELSGELRNNDYTDQNGTKHHSMVVHCDNVGFVGNRDSAQTAQSTPAHTYQRDVVQQAPMQLGDLSDFEEILSDGETPF